MIDISFEQLFGKNAIQTANNITINKADLPGLTAATNNRAESLLAAVLLQAHQNFEGTVTDELERTVTDELERAITYDNRQLYKTIDVWQWRIQFISRQGNKYIQRTYIVDSYDENQ